jgi:hypothetical protein
VKPQNKYRITIHAAEKPRLYRTRGAIAVTSINPMANAARALLEQGADPTATLSGVWEGAEICPRSLHRLARPYTPPRINRYSPVAALNVDA